MVIKLRWCFVYFVYSKTVQKHSNPVFIHPDNAIEEKNGAIQDHDGETAEKESLKEEFGVDL